MSSRRATLALAGSIVLAGAGSAHAYLDAGSGSMMLQLLLGGVAGLGVACRLYWRRLADRFRSRGAHRTLEPVATPTDGGEPRR